MMKANNGPLSLRGRHKGSSFTTTITLMESKLEINIWRICYCTLVQLQFWQRTREFLRAANREIPHTNSSVCLKLEIEVQLKNPVERLYRKMRSGTQDSLV